nr:unnamed protein product [Callosobruchus analis]
MRLLAIENAGETKFLIDALTKFMPNNQNLMFWTSGRKRNGVWFWDSVGSPIHYTNWAPNEPRNIDGTSCIQAFFSYEDSSIKWSVNRCEVPNYFICKSDY